MRTIKCDRCGENIPHVPLYMNCSQQRLNSHNIMVTILNFDNNLAEVDLCDRCKEAVYNYIFDEAMVHD